MTDEVITVFEACRICEYRNTQSIYNRVARRDPGFPRPLPKDRHKEPMKFNRREIELWWANHLYERRLSAGDQFVSYPGDDYYYNLLEEKEVNS